MFNCNFQFPDYHKDYGYDAVDKAVVLGIRYKGTSASGLVTVAATTGDITLSHGVLSSEAADATAGATGVFDLTTYAYLYQLVEGINLSDNWEAWYVDYAPNTAMNVSAGNGILTTAGIAATQAKVDAGILTCVGDTSLLTAEIFPVGVTLNSSKLTRIHNNDHSVIHQIMGIKAHVTYAGATDGLYVYECDDLLHTKTQIGHLPLVSNTATSFGYTGDPLYQTEGKRIVVEATDASGALTSVTMLRVNAKSFIQAPTYDRRNNWAKKSI